MNIKIMDANAISALLRGEAGKEIVAAQLADPNNQCLIHAVNLCEVYYNALRDGGVSAGDESPFAKLWPQALKYAKTWTKRFGS